MKERIRKSGKRNRRTGSFLLALLLLVGILSPVFGVRAEGEEEAKTPRGTFTNSKEESPHLYIQKTVVNADERYPAPEGDVFQFTLQIEGSLVKELEYRVFNAGGAEVYQYSDGESTEVKSNKIPYETSRSGDFTLKAGQTAMFEYVGTGKSYEVTELPIDDYQQIVPEGGFGVSATGTVVADGATVRFTNQYAPTIKAKTTTLEVTKSISYPNGYELPIDPEFTFQLKLKNEAYGLQDYKVKDSSGQINGSGKTKEDGSFTLKAGETAIFEEVTAGVDYEIEEKELDGWRVIGSSKQEGATVAPKTVIHYANACASFAVKKTLSDGTKPNKEFGFILTDGSQKAMKDASYYLYGSDGAYVSNQKTGESGEFTLTPGQTAIFYGISEGIKYGVSEEGDAAYIQKVPESSNGYVGKTVGNTVEVLPFVNEEIPKTTAKALTVTKKVVANELGYTPTSADDFVFILEKKSDSETYEPVKGSTYSITVGSGTSTYSTGEDGTFILRRNETARFEALAGSGTYRVTEAMPMDAYEIYDPDMLEQEGSLSEDLNFVFENVYKTVLVTFNTQKGGLTDETEIPPQGVNYAKTATEPIETVNGTLENEGYSFEGWYSNPECSGEEYDFLTSVTTDMTLYAKWEPIYYTVDFESNGGSKVPAKYNPQSVRHGERAEKPETDPTKDGYYFGGWYTDDETFTKAYDFSTAVKEDITLYAKWTKKPVYQVIFNSNGGTAVATQEVEEGKTAFRPNNPSRDGHTFIGWYTDNGTFQKEYNFGTPVTKTITLHAKWERRAYNVSYYGNGATSGVPTGATLFYGDVYTVSGQIPVRGGYNFNGWTRTDTNVRYTGGQTFSMPARDVTLSANWTAIPVTPPETPEVPPVVKETITVENAVYDVRGGALTETQVKGLVALAAARDGVPLNWSDVTMSASDFAILNQKIIDQQLELVPVTFTTPDGTSATALIRLIMPGEREVTPTPITTTEEKSGPKNETPEEGLVTLSEEELAAIRDGETPLGGFNYTGVWSLLNLIMSLVVLIVGVITLITLVNNRKRKQEDEEREIEFQQEGRTRRYGALKIATGVASVIAMILFLILEDMTLPRVWIDRWTPCIGLAALFGLLVWLIQFLVKRKAYMNAEVIDLDSQYVILQPMEDENILEHAEKLIIARENIEEEIFDKLVIGSVITVTYKDDLKESEAYVSEEKERVRELDTIYKVENLTEDMNFTLREA